VRVGRKVASLHLCRASGNIDGLRELGLVAGELGPQSGHRGGVIMCRRRDSASLVFFALDYRLKVTVRSGPR
jgi:hypothetical protein